MIPQTMSNGAKKMERGFSRYDRKIRFRNAGRECRFCGLITDCRASTERHERNKHEGELLATLRKAAEIEAGVGVTRATGSAA